MGRYKKARWWKLVPSVNMYTKSDDYLVVYGVKINYGDWLGPTILMHDAKILLDHPRIIKKDRDWLQMELEEQGLI